MRRASREVRDGIQVIVGYLRKDPLKKKRLITYHCMRIMTKTPHRALYQLSPAELKAAKDYIEKLGMIISRSKEFFLNIIDEDVNRWRWGKV